MLKQAKARAAALQKEWAAIQEKVSADPGRLDPGAAYLTRIAVALQWWYCLNRSQALQLSHPNSHLHAHQSGAAVLEGGVESRDTEMEARWITAFAPCRGVHL